VNYEVIISEKVDREINRFTDLAEMKMTKKIEIMETFEKRVEEMENILY